jgi:hypothetical protein
MVVGMWVVVRLESTAMMASDAARVNPLHLVAQHEMESYLRKRFITHQLIALTRGLVSTWGQPAPPYQYAAKSKMPGWFQT